MHCNYLDEEIWSFFPLSTKENVVGQRKDALAEVEPAFPVERGPDPSEDVNLQCRQTVKTIEWSCKKIWPWGSHAVAPVRSKNAQ